MLDWLSRRLYLKPSQVLRQGLKKMYDAEKRTTRDKKGFLCEQYSICLLRSKSVLRC